MTTDPTSREAAPVDVPVRAVGQIWQERRCAWMTLRLTGFYRLSSGQQRATCDVVTKVDGEWQQRSNIAGAVATTVKVARLGRDFDYVEGP